MKDLRNPIAWIKAIYMDIEPRFQEVREQKPSILYMEDLRARPWWTECTEDWNLEWIRLLETSQPTIKREFETLQREHSELFYKGPFNTDPLLTHGEHRWDVLRLFHAGVPVNGIVSRCPLTAKIMTSLPNTCAIPSVVGACGFSSIIPGTHIPAHMGETNVRIRYQLALEAPPQVMLY